MFLLDNLLMAPGNAAFVIFKELARKAQEEWLDDDSVKLELQELYSLLESGRISDRDFEARECRLLERLEQIARAKYRDKWGADDEPAVTPTLPAPLVLDAEPVVEQGAMVRPLPAMPGADAPPPAALVDDVVPAPPAAPRPAAATPAPVFAPPAAQPETRIADPVVPPLPPGASLTMGQVMDCAARALAMLKLRVSSITSVGRDEEGWKVTAELVERKGVPDTNDLLGMYELRLDASGNVLRYERTRMRRRGDLSRI